MKNPEYSRAMDAALKYLALRMRSEREVERRLTAKGFDGVCVGEVLERLKELGYINDEAYAEALTRSRREAKGKSAAAVRAELRFKGVDPETIDGALEGADDLETAEKWLPALERKFGTLPPREGRIKAGQFLMRKGFGWDTINSALKGWGEGEDF